MMYDSGKVLPSWPGIDDCDQEGSARFRNLRRIPDSSWKVAAACSSVDAPASEPNRRWAFARGLFRWENVAVRSAMPVRCAKGPERFPKCIDFLLTGHERNDA